jgi:hypothetical protein
MFGFNEFDIIIVSHRDFTKVIEYIIYKITMAYRNFDKLTLKLKFNKNIDKVRT